MKTLVGSVALKHHFPDSRKPKDVDYFSENAVEGAENFYHPLLEQWNFGDIATIDELYTIKVSHAFWSLKNGSWEKHMHDILFLQSKNAQFIPELYTLLYSIWEERYGKKKANLEQSPEDFFNKNVTRVFEHDSIHHSVAYYDEPLFNKILRDGHAVAVDRSKFDNMSIEDKNKLVREEVYATALERQIIPSGYKENPRVAYSWAMKKTLTSFTKGWFPLYIVLNYMELRKPDINYVQKHKDNNHLLIPISAEEGE
jgi:hypothetical protein